MESKKYFGVTGLIDLFERTFDGDAWHGPSIMKVLRNFPLEQINARIGGAHSAIELVEHMTAWRQFAINRLQGNRSYEVAELENFKRMENVDEEDWRTAIEALIQSQKLLLELLKDFPANELSALVDGRSYPFYVLLHGLIHHDLYHLGQIVLLKRV